MANEIVGSTQTQHEALKNAAEQYIAAYADGKAGELLDYFEDIFKDALENKQ